MRIATWNLERPRSRSWKIGPAQQRRMRLVDADIWVLTETRASVGPGDGYHGLHCPPYPERREDTDERWVSIWSRWPLRSLDDVVASPRGTLAAWCDNPERPLLVYGTVLPWAHEPSTDGTRHAWAAHEDEIRRQGAEWAMLRDRYPSTPLVVAGDFNQSRDGSGWYGTRRVRDALTAQLRRAGLQLLTGSDVVADGLLADNHLVDHIAASHADPGAVALACWEPRDGDGVRLSDHPTVAVDLPLHNGDAGETRVGAMPAS